MSRPVVRFAPSPTGYLHIGGARTAIFNWLFARKNNGKFILRIEDTDTERSTDSAIAGIVEGLEWLGLDWDEGPYFQSQFADDHRSAAGKLLDNGWAYKCFCSKDELEDKRQRAQQKKLTYRYDGRCRHLSKEEIAAKEDAGIPYTIRLKVPQGDGGVIFTDSVYGIIEKKYDDIEDFVIVRANGQPLYILSNTVDDIRDGITHVIRGQDGLANTPKQILIYDALGATIPQFAHMSLTLDPQKAKISKRRHGEQVAIHYYRQKGFLPWAMINFLVLLGWSTSDSKEIFTPEELKAAFDFKGIGRTNSVFNINSKDPKFFTDPKLLNMNAHYLRTMRVEQLTPLVKEQLVSDGIWQSDYDDRLRAWFQETIDLIRSRFHLLTDFGSIGRAYFDDDYPMDEKAGKKHLTDHSDQICRWMPALVDTLNAITSWDHSSIESELMAFLSDHQLKPGQLINAVRTSTTGQGVGPEFVQVLIALGQDRVIARLKKTIGSLECGSS
jgi:glutamyl-tRNA synthetase